MTIVQGLVLYAVVWFMTVFVVLPIGLRTQQDEGEVTHGTQAGAPANYRVGRMFLVVTVVATAIFTVLAIAIIFSGLGVRDLDFFGRMAPAAN